jgi:hypothetical protein
VSTLIKLTAAAICGLALTACGGGGGDSNNNPTVIFTYTVTPSVSGSGGTINPATPVSVQSGTTASFTLTPAAGYTVASVGGTCGGTLNGNTYTTKAVTADCTVVAAFSGGTTYTVTPSVSGSGGAINPVTPVSVKSGTTTSFTLTPSSGYSVASVTGTCGGTLSGNTYTTKAVAASCTVIAAFTAASQPLTFNYQQIPSADPLTNPTTFLEQVSPTGFLAQINQEGSQGYFYQDAAGMCGDATFVNDSTGQQYTYDLLLLPGNMADFITQANAEGAKGYRYLAGNCLLGAPGSYVNYAVYRKDVGLSATYTYADDPILASLPDFLTQANGRGQAGYWLYPYVPPVGSTGNLYVKNNASNATYTYDVLAQPSTVNDYLAQLNSEGTNGYLALGTATASFSGAGITTVYVKDQTQAAIFTYQPPASSAPSALIDQMNSYGAQSYAYWGILQLGTNGPIGSYYVKASHCSGWMCTAPDHTVAVLYATPGTVSTAPVQSN